MRNRELEGLRVMESGGGGGDGDGDGERRRDGAKNEELEAGRRD